MKRRRTPLRSDAAKQRAWQRKARLNARKRAKLRVKLREFNPARRAKLGARNFGAWADTIRRLPCASCYPWQYMDGMPLPEPGPFRLSDPSHSRPRQMGGCGGDRTTLFPQCRRHHQEYESRGSKVRNEYHRLRYGIDPRLLSRRLWEYRGNETGR